MHHTPDGGGSRPQIIRTTSLGALVLALLVALAALAGCAAQGAPAAGADLAALEQVTAATDPDELDAMCRSGGPAPADQHTVAQAPHAVRVLVVNQGDEDPGAVHARTLAALYDASAAGADVVVASVTGAHPVVAALVGEGANPSERHADRCRRLAAAAEQVVAMLASPGADGGLWATVATALDTVTTAWPASPGTPTAPDALVVLGSARDRGPGGATLESLDDPQGTLAVLETAGLLRECTGTSVVVAGPDASPGAQAGAALRSLWLSYAATCGGSVVGWSPSYAGVGTTVLTAPLATDPTAVATPTVADVPEGRVWTLPAGALFPVNSAVLSAEARASLDEVAGQLAGARRVEIIGYTDAGTVPWDPGLNDRLSLARAQAVADHLAPSIPAGAVVEVSGRGAADPVAPDTDAQRHLNRRVVVVAHAS